MLPLPLFSAQILAFKWETRSSKVSYIPAKASDHTLLLLTYEYIVCFKFTIELCKTTSDPSAVAYAYLLIFPHVTSERDRFVIKRPIIVAAIINCSRVTRIKYRVKGAARLIPRLWQLLVPPLPASSPLTRGSCLYIELCKLVGNLLANNYRSF